MLGSASLGDEAETLFSWCISTAKKRAFSIVSNQYRRSYWKAATLIVACGEVMVSRGQQREAEALISEIASQFPRHRSFQDELRAARARR